MSSFMGGSAFAMASQIAEGYILVTNATIKKLNKSERVSLEAELEKILRDIRGEQPPLDDTPALQKRNRKISRINQAKMIVRNAP